MALNFPSTPANGQIYTANGRSWSWTTDGNTWVSLGASLTWVPSVYYKLDNIASQFGGSNVTFTVASSGKPIYPIGAENLLLSLGGIIQEPGSAYTVNSFASTVTFSNAPAVGEAFFGVAFQPLQSTAGKFAKLDALTFNGSQTVFTLTSSGTQVTPGTAQNLLLVIDGQIQEPVAAYTISGNTVTFTSAPANNATFFGTVFGSPIDVGNITPGVDIEPRLITTSSNTVVGGNVAVGQANATGVACELVIGNRADQTANGERGWRMSTWTNEHVYLDAKTKTNGQLHFRCGHGTENGAYRAWNVVDANTGIPNFPQGIKERDRTTPLGEWITPAYANTDFYGSGSMTWAVEQADISTYAYTLIGKTLILSFALSGTTVGGSASTMLFIKVPGGFSIAKPALNPYLMHCNTSGRALGYIYAATGENVIRLYKDLAGGANHELGSFQAYGQIALAVN